MTLSVLIHDGDLFGAGVATHWFNSGMSVPWLRPGTGAVLTQGFTDRSFGWRGLDLLSEGIPPDEVIERLLDGDIEGDRRQVAVMSSDGRSAVHTGSRCLPVAGSRWGDDWVVAGNLLVDEGVLDAMADAVAESTGSLQERILTVLESGETAGGDVRGTQSAALRVAASDGTPFDRDWIELVVADHEDPVGELARLVPLEEAYRHLGSAMDIPPGMASAVAHRRIATLTPEIGFWQAIGLAQSGARDDAGRIWAHAHGTAPELLDTLLERHVEAGIIGPDIANALRGSAGPVLP